MNRGEITADVAARLIAGQFPQWTGLPVAPVKLNGWDNTTFRLGDELSIRLPSADEYAAQVGKEHHWLPVLAPRLPLLIPQPVAMGRPSDEFPRPWSVYRWIAGEPASGDQITDPVRFASSLTGFMAALHAIDASDGPPAGAHSFNRGGPLSVWDEQTRQLIRVTADDIDAGAATEVWDAALASAWEQAPVWVHGDVTGSNLLIRDGALHAVIDFGCAAVGDPACDLVMEWTFFTGESAAAFRGGLHLDEATWARGRGWALWKALLMIGEEKEGRGDGQDAARRFGWRYSPRQIVDLVIADHTRLPGTNMLTVPDGAEIREFGNRFDGRVVVVIGAGQTPGPTIGNGRATAMLFARRGAHVIAVDRDRGAADETVAAIGAAGHSAVAMAADATDEKAIAELLASVHREFGRIDVLHNNVGISLSGNDAPVTDITVEAFDFVTAVNLRSMVIACKHAIGYMRRAGTGVITNISSIAAVLDYPYIAYKTSKAGVIALTSHLAIRYAADGIRAN